MDQKKKPSKDPQIIVLLRAIGGAYLLYLAWGLRDADFSGKGIVFLIALIVFAVVGAALLIFSVRQLIRGDYLRPGQSPDSGEDTEPEPETEPEEDRSSEDGGE